MNDTQQPANSSATGTTFTGLSDEERAAMKQRAQELKAEARRGPRADKADAERDVLDKIAEMPQPDRVMAEGSMRSSRPARQPCRRKPGTGCPPMPRTARSSASSRARTSSSRGMRRSASTSRRTSTRAPCGRSLRADGVDRRRRGKDRRAREEGSELRTELTVQRCSKKNSTKEMLDMESTTPLAVIGRYFDALSAKDFATVAGMFADDIVWHQPGANRFSGTHRGSAAVNEMIGGMMAVSGGTFELALTAAPMVNGLLVAAPVRFAAQRDGTTMAIDGVDLLRVEGDGIAEVWLFTADQQAEDAFWGPG